MSTKSFTFEISPAVCHAVMSPATLKDKIRNHINSDPRRLANWACMFVFEEHGLIVACIAGWAVLLHPLGEQMRAKLHSYENAAQVLLGLANKDIFFTSDEKAISWLNQSD